METQFWKTGFQRLSESLQCSAFLFCSTKCKLNYGKNKLSSVEKFSFFFFALSFFLGYWLRCFFLALQQTQSSKGKKIKFLFFCSLSCFFFCTADACWILSWSTSSSFGWAAEKTCLLYFSPTQTFQHRLHKLKITDKAVKKMWLVERNQS